MMKIKELEILYHLRETIYDFSETIESILEDLEEVERRPSKSAVAHVDDHVEVFVLLKELDFKKEAERLKGKISKLIKEKERYVKKLENPMFVSRASEDIVEETRKKLEDLSTTITRLQNLLQELEG